MMSASLMGSESMPPNAVSDPHVSTKVPSLMYFSLSESFYASNTPLLLTEHSSNVSYRNEMSASTMASSFELTVRISSLSTVIRMNHNLDGFSKKENKPIRGANRHDTNSESTQHPSPSSSEHKQRN